MSSITSYNDLVENLLKLHKCYRVQMLISSDIINKIDLLARPYSSLVLATSIWVVDMMKRNILGYGEIVYIQRRLAQFLSQASRSEKELLKKLLNLLPSKIGEDIGAIFKRCMIEQQKLVDIIRILNFINEIVILVESEQNINEPIRRVRKLCLYDLNLLPPTHGNSKTYIQLLIKALNNTPEIQREPLLLQSLELIEMKFSKDNLDTSDLAAIALVALTIARHLHSTTICVEPCIELETFARKIYTDLMDMGADPSKSEIYKIYQELSTKSVFRKFGG
ncbi:MAG: hypothetical protein QXJ95_06285 [Ignisphaera sp.]